MSSDGRKDDPTPGEWADTVAGSPATDPTLLALPEDGGAPAAKERASSSAGLAQGAIVDRYVILDQLGAGGMGVVYRAYDPELDRRIALKFLRPDLSGDADLTTARSRLLREAQAQAKLSHPNVVAVYDAGTVDDEVFIAMELVDGMSLGDWLQEEDQSQHKIISAFLAAGRGLAAAHRAGLVHRDFKPDNVIVGEDGRIRVLDFGLASPDPTVRMTESSEVEIPSRSLDTSLNSGNTISGTPAFMSPEQHELGAVSAASDQFSFCVALYKALYRRPPFAGSTYRKLANNVCSGKVQPARKEDPVPTWLRTILLRGLEVEPESRFLSMDELLAELQNDPVARRKRQILFAAATAIVAAVSILVFSILRGPTLAADYCQDNEGHLTGVWDDATRTTIRTAFEATGRPYAADTYARVAKIMDRRSDAWVSMRQDACEDTHVRGEQSPQLLDARMACLDRRLAELRALNKVFVDSPGGAVVDNAVQAAHGLPSLEGCDDAEALNETVPPPEDPEVRARVMKLQDRLAEATALQRAGEYKRGLTLARAIRAEARETSYLPLEAEVSYLVGELEQEGGDAKKAEEILKETAELAARARDDELLARIWTELIWVVHIQGRYDDAALLIPAAEAAVMRAGDRAFARSQLDSFIGSILSGQGNYEEAIIRHDRALLAARKASPPPTESAIAALLSTKASTLRAQGKLKEARESHEEALRLREGELGPDHPSVAETLNNLALVVHRQADREAARKHLERALRIFEQAFGQDHFHVGSTLNNLGLVLADQGDKEGAKKSYLRAIEVLESTHGLQHPSLANCLNSLGFIWRDEGKLDEALASHERALTIYQKMFASDHVDIANTLTSLGLVLKEKGSYEEAHEKYERALQMYEKALGPAHPRVAIVLSNLGELANTRGQYTEAIRYCERALTIDTNTLGETHPDIAYDLDCIGEANLKSNALDAAIGVYERALQLREHDTGDPQLVAESRFSLAQALWARKAKRPLALTLAKSARDTFHESKAEDFAEVDAWLRKRGAQ